jgi:uncharacterized protein (TIGR03435 family)
MRPTLVTSVCALLPICLSSAQSTPSAPAYEVASIKLNTSGGNGTRMNGTKGEYMVTNATLKNLIQNAYDVREYSFSGPDWLSSVRFDINAKFPPEEPGITPQQRQATRRLMLQNLLQERFKLTAHHETRMLSGYALLVGKKGPKLKDCERKDGTSVSQNNGNLDGQGMSMENLANVVAGILRGPVADMTGLDGKYDIKLEWSQDEGKPGGDTEKPADVRPSIFTALQDTLGLRLETRKIPVETLIVDHVERTPTEN